MKRKKKQQRGNKSALKRLTAFFSFLSLFSDKQLSLCVMVWRPNRVTAWVSCCQILYVTPCCWLVTQCERHNNYKTASRGVWGAQQSKLCNLRPHLDLVKSVCSGGFTVSRRWLLYLSWGTGVFCQSYICATDPPTPPVGHCQSSVVYLQGQHMFWSHNSSCGWLWNHLWRRGKECVTHDCDYSHTINATRTALSSVQEQENPHCGFVPLQNIYLHKKLYYIFKDKATPSPKKDYVIFIILIPTCQALQDNSWWN